MEDTKRPLLLPWVHTIIVAILLAIPTYVVPHWVHDRIELHGELPESPILSGFLGFVGWVQSNMILTLIILGAFSLDVFLCRKLRSIRTKAIYTTIVAMAAIAFIGVLLYVCKNKISS